MQLQFGVINILLADYWILVVFNMNETKYRWSQDWLPINLDYIESTKMNIYIY